MNILITGGAGFIGSNLARKLSLQGHNICIVDSLFPDYGGNMANLSDIKDNLDINILDLRDTSSIRPLLKGVDLIYNLAAQTSHLGSIEDPINDLDINSRAQLLFLQQVIDVCPDAVVVYASTRQIYGTPQYLPVDEKHPINPVDINGVTKYSAEKFHSLFHKIYGLRTISLRLTNTYGPGMRVKDAKQTFLGIWIKNVLQGKPIIVYGDGSQIRDFNFVDDVADAFILVSKSPNCYGKVLNLGSKDIINLTDLAELLISRVNGSSLEYVPFPSDRKSIDIGDFYGDYKLAESIIAWSPKICLSEGLSNTLSYYKTNLNSYL